MNYRLATFSDISQLVELRLIEQKNDWEDKYKITEELKRATEKFFEKELGKKIFVFVAEDNGKVVATTAVIIHQYLPQADEITGKRGYLCDVFTIPSYRRKGIQKKLMNKIINFSKDVLEIARLDLHSSLKPEVFEMYKKSGWEFVENNARLFL